MVRASALQLVELGAIPLKTLKNCICRYTAWRLAQKV